MKKLFLISFVIILFAAQNSFAQSVFVSGSVRANLMFDYSPLNEYGEWIEIEPNQIVWRPVYVSELWRPYSVGRWIWTDYGWYWDSYEPFGAVTFHYGRWNYDYRFGWVWFPDYEWGPAWVEWRYSSAYIGWAPLSPYSIHNGAVGVVTINYSDNFYYWNFVSYRHFYGGNLERRILYGNRVSSVFANSKRRRSIYYRNGAAYNGGIEREIVERRSGQKIRTRNISEKIRRTKTERKRENSARINPRNNGHEKKRVSKRDERSENSETRSRSEVKKSNERNRSSKVSSRNR